MAQITYDDKVALNENPSVAEINKVTDDNMNEIKDTINTNTPVGSISLFAGATAPNGWLICDGSAVSRTTYANLFSVIGTTYGAGDGSTTFNIPDIQNRVPVGLNFSDTDFDTLGKTGGEKEHRLTINEIPSHNHNTVSMCSFPEGVANSRTGYGYNEVALNKSSYGNTVGNTGGGQAHNNLQPYIVMNYIISY
jgi:microcystin-dependent protein